MKRKVDYSRMVTLDLSPTEAAIIAGVLAGTVRTPGMRERLGTPVTKLVEGTVEQIQFQLKALHWPLNGELKAPYPV